MPGKLITVRATRHSRASASAIFELLDDAQHWPRWAVVQSVSFDAPGDADRREVGARRTFHTGPFHVYEEIVVREPDRRIEYILLRGMPMKDYRGRVELTPVADGTRIDWTSSFRPAYFGTGWFWRLFMTKVLRDMSRDVSKAAEAGIETGARTPLPARS
jgi:uncharacterized protein YndB with AHSA1/START domain